MHECLQMEGMSIYQHGEMVRDYYTDLLNHLEHGDQLKYEWRLPSWLLENREFILSQLLDRETMAAYHLYHDSGKPACLQIDEEGRRRFLNHAAMSYLTWGRHSDNRQIGKLILMDMDAHLLKSECIPEFASRPEAISLLLTAIAEIHANASMFGGINSTSFKIKYKHLDKRGKAIIQQSSIHSRVFRC